MILLRAGALSLSVRSIDSYKYFLSASRTSTRLFLSSSSNDEVFAPRLDGLNKPTVWQEFSPLATKYNAVNLGQGFPDEDPPEFAIEAMIDAVNPNCQRNANQYARPGAHLPLAKVLAEKYYSERFGRSLHPETEVATAVGCTNALYCALQGLISPGDEVIMFEPTFDIYMAHVKLAGGKGVFIPLRTTKQTHDSAQNTANEIFQVDFNELQNAITDKTKAIILNTPHNPTGKMFSKEELTKISEILEPFPHIVVLSDEVYEHIIFDQLKSPHISIASLPGMFQKTLTLSSSGKTFSATGWKVGWAVGPAHLVRAVSSIQQWINFCAATPNQDAVALCLERALNPYKGFDTYYQYLASAYLRKRSLLLDALESARIDPIVPLGGFFIMGDTSKIDFPSSYLEEVTDAMPANPMPRDWALSRWMTKEVGVTPIPPSAFYENDHYLAKDILRFAFCKGDDTIIEAGERFKKYFH